jgi:hypothetical protein
VLLLRCYYIILRCCMHADAAGALMQACMADDPAARPEFAEVEAECRALAAMAAAGTLAAGNDT